jgi:DNA-binding CsgD family transcriptional regulator
MAIVEITKVTKTMKMSMEIGGIEIMTEETVEIKMTKIMKILGIE